jgi:hypothetical protein
LIKLLLDLPDGCQEPLALLAHGRGLRAHDLFADGHPVDVFDAKKLTATFR